MAEGITDVDAVARAFEDGSLTIEQVRIEYGHVIARSLLLARYATQQHDPWPRLDYPPKMFISHKWRDDGTACPEATQLAEALKATGTEVVFDDWWPEHTDDLEWHIAQLAASRTVFFLLTREYFEHTSLAVEAGRFRATWVEDELSFVRHVYQTQLESHPRAGAVIDATGLLLDPDREPIPWFSRLFDLRTPERWQAFLASFDGLRVHRLTAAERAEIRAEAQAHAKAFVAGHEPEAFSGLARLAGRFPFVGDLAVMLVTMAREVGDFERARQVAELGVRSTEPWRWEHRWLRSRATMGPD